MKALKDMKFEREGWDAKAQGYRFLESSLSQHVTERLERTDSEQGQVEGLLARCERLSSAIGVLSEVLAKQDLLSVSDLTKMIGDDWGIQWRVDGKVVYEAFAKAQKEE